MERKAPRPLWESLKRLFYQKEGPLTDEMRLTESPVAGRRLPERLAPDRVLRAVCGYCSTGCSLDVHLKEGAALNVTPTGRHPVNTGWACPKGWEVLSPLRSGDRALRPLLKKDGGFVEVDWPTALETFVRRFRGIQDRHGPASVAFLSTGQIPSEEMALLGALTKFGMGILHGDGNTRQCMATAVVAYKQSFGFDAPPYTFRDFEESDVMVFVGSNVCIAHPIMWEHVEQNPHDPKIIVVDPRRTETAMAADRHYAIHPKTDMILLSGVARILVRNGWIDETFVREHTTGFEEWKAHLEGFPIEMVSERTGIPPEGIREFAEWIHEGRRVSFWWTMGVNQGYESVRTAQTIINLALMTGNIGRPGTGANSITGQCNAMGSRLFSNTTNLLGGHDFADPGHRRKVAGILGIPEDRIPSENSWAYDRIIAGIENGEIKGLWVIATNPAHSWIHQGRLREILSGLDFLVVQDMYHSTETARTADLILPAAGWGEKEGTFINSERRIGLVRKVAEPPGEALSDFEIFHRIAEAWGCADLFEAWKTPEDVFGILKRVSAGQPCDITGIEDYAMIEREGGIQWPFPEGACLETPYRRLFEDGRFFHPDGRARFLFEAPRPRPEDPDDAYPFILLTGRGTSAQWHTQTRTSKSAVLRRMYPAEPYVEMNPQDAVRLGIDETGWVRVRTRRAEVRVRASVTPTIRPGQIFMPMHYAETNRLTFPAFDPYSRQPSYKLAAAAVEPC